MNDIVLKAEITSLGGIVSNAQAILDGVLLAAATYKSDSYEPDEVTAKNDKALLNRQLRDIKSARINIEKQYNQPLNEFLATCKRIELEASEAIAAVDAKTKQYDETRKRAKREEIERLFPDNSPVTLNQIFDLRWLNKTYNINDIRADIASKIAEVDENLRTIESVVAPEDYNAVKARYLDDLIFSEALTFGKKLADSRASETAQKEALLEREEKREGIKESVKNLENFKHQELKVIISDVMPEAAEKLYEYTFTAKGTAAMFKALKSAILDNGGTYEKIDLTQYTPRF